MERLLPALLLLLLFGCAGSRTYSEKEMVRIAQRLGMDKILSEKGVQSLLRASRMTGAESVPAPAMPNARIYPGLYWPGGKGADGKWMAAKHERSAVTVLFFLSEAFHAEYLYRTGFIETMKLELVWRARYAGSVASEQEIRARNAALNDTLAKLSLTFPGGKLETAIPEEDPSDGRGFTFYGWAVNPDGFDAGFVHPTRSALGKGRTRLVHDLKRAGLVSQTVEDSLRSRIRANKLRTESEVLKEAAMMTAEAA